MDKLPRKTGLDLKLQRISARVRLGVLADQMGISSSRLSRIEKPEPVTERMVARYTRALNECRTFGTSAVA